MLASDTLSASTFLADPHPSQNKRNEDGERTERVNDIECTAVTHNAS
jgi:hypothetical protein